MNQVEAKAAVLWFGELFATLTPAQARTLRDSLAPYADDAFRAAARTQVLRTPFASDAIVGVMTELRAAAKANVQSGSEMTRRMLQRVHADIDRATRENAEDDAAIAEAPADVLRRVADEVLASMPADEAAFLRARGFLVRRAWRGLVAKALRLASVAY